MSLLGEDIPFVDTDQRPLFDHWFVWFGYNLVTSYISDCLDTSMESEKFTPSKEINKPVSVETLILKNLIFTFRDAENHA